MKKIIKFISLILLSINIASCSSIETKNIKAFGMEKEWLKPNKLVFRNQKFLL